MNACRILVVAAILCPFYLNDLANIHVHDWRWWLAIDYVAVKLLPLAVLAWLWRSGRLAPADLGLAPQPALSFAVTMLGLALAATVIDQNAYRVLAGLPGYPPLGAMPPIPVPLAEWIDLTVGLALVAAVEELVFRAWLYRALRRRTANVAIIIAVSAAAFGLIHWSGGLHAVLITAAIGALFMGAYVRTRRIAPIIGAHFVVNFVDFAGVVPEAWFQLG